MRSFHLLQKTIALFILFLCFQSCTEKKESENYSSGRKKRETCYTGEHKTMETSWYQNGQLQYIEKYSAEGLLDGERLAWDSTGSMQQNFYISKGTQDSLITFQKQIKSMTTIEKEWKTDSSKHTVISWYPNGKMRSRRDQVNSGSVLVAKPKRSVSQTWDAMGIQKNRMESYYTKGEPDSTVSVSWYVNGMLENRHTSYFNNSHPGSVSIKSVSYSWDSLGGNGTKTYFSEEGNRDSVIHLANRPGSTAKIP
jgi:antitoxin component YwqK of YwqJK toxin-antitoxin module